MCTENDLKTAVLINQILTVQFIETKKKNEVQGYVKTNKILMKLTYIVITYWNKWNKRINEKKNTTLKINSSVWKYILKWYYKQLSYAIN